MNRSCFIGRLTRDPELEKSRNGKEFVKFTIAVNRPYKNDQGQSQADFIQCIAYGNTATSLCRYCSKGHRIGVEGRLMTSSYDDKQTGKRVYSWNIQADNIEFLESKSSGNQNSGFDPLAQEQQSQQGSSYDDEFSTDNTLDIASDDLPF